MMKLFEMIDNLEPTIIICGLVVYMLLAILILKEIEK